ncbi:hypothetical protein BQ8482_180412 [Mesorhizobium delmotii]|uniref:Uncharacterized protein n=1 Tax=Mesorhizobium delmotii TaxID=1631247 RepID=A0A2P9AJ62_9HYPH|nr:hypothetical protein BQ8482_180412 [Mesorhizobium delmotii]
MVQLKARFDIAPDTLVSGAWFPLAPLVTPLFPFWPIPPIFGAWPNFLIKKRRRRRVKIVLRRPTGAAR